MCSLEISGFLVDMQLKIRVSLIMLAPVYD